MKLSGFSIQAHLWALAFLVAAPSSAVVLSGLVRDYRDTREQLALHAMERARFAAAEFKARIDDGRALLERLAMREDIRAMDRQKCEPVLSDAGIYREEFTFMSLSDLEGSIICSGFRPTPAFAVSYRDRWLLRAMVDQPGFHIEAPFLGRRSMRWVAALGYPVRDAFGKPIGMLVLPIDLARARFLSAGFTLPSASVIGVLDERGIMIASSIDPEKRVGLNIAATGIGQGLLQSAADTGHFVATGPGGGNSLVAYAAVPGTSWKAYVTLELESLRSDLWSAHQRELLITLAAILAALLVGVVISRHIAAPMAALRHASRMWRTGVTAEPVPESGPREVVDAAREFNAMLQVRKAEQVTLSRSEERLRALVEASSQIFWITRSDGNIEHVSGSFPAGVPAVDLQRLYGYGWMGLIHPEDRVDAEQAWQAAAHARARFERVLRVLTSDGGYRFYFVRGIPVLEPDGRLREWVGTCSDIHDRRVAESQLRSTTQSLARAESIAGMGSFTRDLSSATQVWSSQLYRILGYEPGEVVCDYHAVLARVHPEERERYALERAAILARPNASFSRRHRLLLPDGEVRHVAVRVEVEWAEGQPKKIYGTMQDVTEQVLAERALQDSENKLSAIIESAMDAVISTDEAHRIILFNAAAEQIFGYRSEEIIGADLSRLVPGWRGSEQRALLRQFDRDYEQARRMGRAGRATGLRRNGEEFPVEASISHIHSDAMEVYTVILRDVTDQVRHEEEIQALNAGLERRIGDRTAELQAANEALRAFSYSVSHDLRAPARAINAFASMLRESDGERLSDQGLHFIEVMERNGRRMGEMIDDLLALTRVGHAELQRQRVDMAGLAREVGEIERVPFPRAQFAVGEMPEARADRGLVSQLLTNLIGNALKFSSRSQTPLVEVGARTGDEGIVYFVRDNGAGFDPAYADKLFHAFQRLHSPAEFEGTGIGLAIVHRIVERHGGRVWADSRPGQGATFWFTLG